MGRMRCFELPAWGGFDFWLGVVAVMLGGGTAFLGCGILLDLLGLRIAGTASATFGILLLALLYIYCRLRGEIPDNASPEVGLQGVLVGSLCGGIAFLGYGTCSGDPGLLNAGATSLTFWALLYGALQYRYYYRQRNLEAFWRGVMVVMLGGGIIFLGIGTHFDLLAPLITGRVFVLLGVFLAGPVCIHRFQMWIETVPMTEGGDE